MAERLTETKAVDAKALKQGLTDIERLKANARDYNGQAGQRTNQLVEALGLDKGVIGYCAGIKRKETAKQRVIVEDTIAVFQAMGWLEEFGLFGTALENGVAAGATISASAEKSTALQDAITQAGGPPKPVDDFDAAAPAVTAAPTPEPTAETVFAPAKRGRKPNADKVKEAADRAEATSRPKLRAVGPDEGSASPGISGGDLAKHVDRAGFTH